MPVSRGRGAGSVPVYMHTPNAIKSHSTSRDARSSVHTRPSPVVVDIRCLSSIGININRDYFNITIIFSIFAYNKV